MTNDIDQHQRKAVRNSLFLSATLRVDGQEEPVTVRVRNLSDGGMMVDGHAEFVVDRRVEIELRGAGVLHGRIAWTEAGRAGVAFDSPIDPSEVRYRPEGVIEPAYRQAAVGRRPGLRIR